VPRFYDPDGRRVLLGGRDARTLALADVHAATALVTQRPILFSESLRENLARRAPGRAVGGRRARLRARGRDGVRRRAARRLGHAIGERGVNLSGGQRQRVALARALLSDAPVLVLDDPLSAVDTQTELRIVARLRGALAGRAVLLATQRLSTLALADRIAVLEEGEIVEEGTAAELLARDGAFAALFGEDALAGVRPPTGLRRLRRHIAQRRGWLALLLGCAIVEAFAQSGSWLLVRLAINEGSCRVTTMCWRSRRRVPGRQPHRLGAVRLRHPRHGAVRPGARASACGASCSTTSRRSRCATSPSSGPAGSSPG
jgi:ABC-type branched-subunit amino acid transport system ATPase component